jgi:ubiquinone/menaquinone biosynthesis C-methylase UbiE
LVWVWNLIERASVSSNYDEWDQVYRKNPLQSLPWELCKPRPLLVDLVERGIIKPGKVLDLCCGAGSNTVFLAEKGFSVTGIDISSKAIEYARDKAGRANVEIEFLVQNFLKLPFEDGYFDFVFDMGCFHHVTPRDRERFVGGVHRVLKVGGLYLLTCFSYRNGPGWNHFTRKQLFDIFSGLFEIKEVWHAPSVEGDGFTWFFFTVLMVKKA